MRKLVVGTQPSVASLSPAVQDALKRCFVVDPGQRATAAEAAACFAALCPRPPMKQAELEALQRKLTDEAAALQQEKAAFAAERDMLQQEIRRVVAERDTLEQEKAAFAAEQDRVQREDETRVIAATDTDAKSKAAAVAASLADYEGAVYIRASYDVAHFEILLAGVKKIKGDVRIECSPITEDELLRLFGSVQEITGYLLIENVSLANVEGLRSLTNIGGYLSINRNGNLVSVEGLRSLKFIRNTIYAPRGGLAILLNDNPILARGLPFPALTCKSGFVYPESVNAYVTANIPALSSFPWCLFCFDFCFDFFGFGFHCFQIELGLTPAQPTAKWNCARAFEPASITIFFINVPVPHSNPETANYSQAACGIGYQRVLPRPI